MGLRKRIMLLVAIGLLVATVPLGVMGLGMARAAIDRILEERLASTRATADHLNQRLARGWWQLHQLSAQAALVWNSAKPADIGQALAAVSPESPLFSGFFLVDRRGRLLVQKPASPSLRLASPARNPTISAVFLTRVQQTSSIERTSSGLPVVFFAVPVFASPNHVVGVVGGIIDLTTPTLLTFITGLAQGASGHAAIVARDGVVLASTDPAELFTRSEHPAFFARFIVEGRALVGPAEEVQHGAGGRGETHIMAFARIASAPWGLGVGQTEQETFGPLRQLRDRIIVFEVLVLIAAVVFAWLDTGAVAAPLRVLQMASERIAGGDLDRKVEVRRGDEIGSLARSFEAMRLQLRRSLEENARLQERVQSLAMVEERERIAREMHDGVGQVLGYVNTKAQAVGVLLDAGRITEARAQLAQLEAASQAVYADLREAILNLRSASTAGGHLLPALHEYARRFEELTGIHTEIEVIGNGAPIALGPTTDLHVIRIIQEALANVRKHAMSGRARLRYATGGGELVITVIDDGVGFDPAARAGPGWPRFGLQTMRERAEAIGGTLAVTTRPGEGTEVCLRVPVPGRVSADARLAG